MKRLLIIFAIAISTLAAHAQVTVEARIDSLEMVIGQQTNVTVTATAKEGSQVEFTNYKPLQLLTPGVEVVEMGPVNTKGENNGLCKYSRTYTITSFDGKLYYLPPFTVKVNGKEYKSKSLALKVLEIAVDTTNVDKFYGPKDVQDNPFSWNDWSAIFWLSLLMLLMSAITYYLYLRLRDNKPIVAHIRIVKRLLPHQKAMKEIEIIKAEKMVSSENQKEYYTKLTETLRKYIEERYGFRAMEMTSGEIIDRLTETQDKEALDELRMLFQTADLVKFAKYSTLINENDMNLVNAIEFINKTKIENPKEEVVEKPQLSEEEVRSAKTRQLLKIVIWTLITAAAATFCYVVYETMLLIL
ncbi:MAG: BatD family protein [Prevotella sp.]